MMLLESDVVGKLAPLLVVADGGEPLSLFEGVHGDVKVLLMIHGDFFVPREAGLL